MLNHRGDSLLLRLGPTVLPYLLTPLREVIHLLIVFRADHVADVSGHLLEEQGF